MAIYFQDELVNNGYLLDKKNGYCVDVEYNRFGIDVGTSKFLFCTCINCQCRTTCNKCEEHSLSGAITIDMVLHRRGKTELRDNIVCVEIKLKHVRTTNNSIACDEQRIKELCNHPTIERQPYYQYGLALHLVSKFETEGLWYHNGESSQF